MVKREKLKNIYSGAVDSVKRVVLKGWNTTIGSVRRLQSNTGWQLSFSIFVLCAIIVLFILGLVGAQTFRVERRVWGVMEKQVLRSAEGMAADIQGAVSGGNPEQIGIEIEQAWNASEKSGFLFVTDTDGQVIYTSKEKQPSKVLLNRIGVAMRPSVKRIGSKAAAAIPLSTESGASAGGLFYIVSSEEYLSEVSALYRSLLFGSLGVLLAALVAAIHIGRRMTRPFEEAMAAVRQLSDDTSQQGESLSIGEFETIQFLQSLKALGTLIDTQRSAVETLKREMSDISNDYDGTLSKLASSAVAQATSVSKTASTVTQMERTALQASGNVDRIVTAAKKTAAVSREGQQALKNASEIITQIKTDSEEYAVKSRALLESIEDVGNITQSVKAISEQSKILAVNAAIEAAKAGRFGAGFAVVAQEVKVMAQQSKEATFQIADALKHIHYDIKSMVDGTERGKARTDVGVDTIADAGAVMNGLSKAIHENSNTANIISENIQHLIDGLSQISSAIEEISTEVMKNVEDISSAVNEKRKSATRIGH